MAEKPSQGSQNKAPGAPPPPPLPKIAAPAAGGPRPQEPAAVQEHPVRRAHERYDVDVVADVRVGSEVIAARTRNLSEGGVGLLTDMALSEGIEVWLSLFLTVDEIEDEATEPLPLQGTIQWAAEAEPGVHHSGVKFGAMEEEERQVLLGFLSQVSEE